MRRIVLSGVAVLLSCASLFAAEVEVGTSPKPAQSPKPPQRATPTTQATPVQKATPVPKATPTSQSAGTPRATPTPQGTATPGELPLYRPALLGVGPNSVINRMDTQDLIKKGQKDGSVMFCCSVTKKGEIANTWTYRGTPGSLLLEQELVRRLDQTLFVPAVYSRELVHVLFYGTVTFSIANGKPRLRIFANQEAAELKKESDFVGPQPFVGRDSKFEGLHFPDDVLDRSDLGSGGIGHEDRRGGKPEGASGCFREPAAGGLPACRDGGFPRGEIHSGLSRRETGRVQHHATRLLRAVGRLVVR